jgi:hypothetical protein
MRSLRAQEVHSPAIARVLGRAKVRVWRTIRKLGLASRHSVKWPWSVQDLRQLQAMRAAGASTSSCAIAFDMIPIANR